MCGLGNLVPAVMGEGGGSECVVRCGGSVLGSMVVSVKVRCAGNVLGSMVVSVKVRYGGECEGEVCWGMCRGVWW